MKSLGPLWLQVLIATAAGIALGLAAPDIGAQMKPLGDAFIALVRMIIAPVVFCTLVHGVVGARDLGRVGKVGVMTLGYFLAVTLIALIAALIAVNLWRPGAGLNIAAHDVDVSAVAGYARTAQEQSLAAFLLGIIPSSFLSAFAEPAILPVVLVSLLFAAALARLGEAGRPIAAFIEGLSRLMFQIVDIVMRAAPIGAFGAMAFAVAKFGPKSLAAMGALLAEFYAVSALFVAVVFGAIAASVGVNLLRLVRYLREEIVIVAATTSTETVLPRLMRKLGEIGCDESIVALVVPTGYSFNLDGTCLYLATVTVFLAQATNTPMTLQAQIELVALLLITSKGAAAVPGAAFVVLAMTLGAMGTIPVWSIGLVFGIHRLLAEALTFVNLIGNALAAIVICAWQGALDRARLAPVARARSQPTDSQAL